MLSYHPWPTKSWNEAMLQRGWRTADTIDMARIAAGIVRYPWSPCVWRGGDKRAANFQHADLIALDFDTPDMPMAQAVKAFCDMAHVIGTTKSHQRDKGGVVCDRYRVVLRLERRIDSAETFKATLAYAMRHYPADTACKDGGRFFWPCTEIVSVAAEGFAVDVQEPPPPEPPGLSAYDAAGVMPKSAIRLVEGWLTKGDRHRQIYLAGFDLGMAGWVRAEALALLEASPAWKDKPARTEFSRTLIDAHTRGLVKRQELSRPVFNSSNPPPSG